MCKIISSVGSSGVTIVQNRFLDEYLVDASEHELKVYLYLLRYLYAPGADIAIKAMADALDYSETKIKKALKHWQEEGLLSYVISDETGEIVKICIEDVNSIGAPKAEAMPKKEAVIAPKKEEAPKKPVLVPLYSKEQIASISADEHFKSLIDMVESILKKNLQPKDICVLAEIYEGLEFNDELIEYLYKFSAELGKRDAKYIEKIAIDWAEQGVTSVKEADAACGRRDSFIGKLKGIFGKSDNFGTRELEYIDSWLYNQKYPIELIYEACNRSVIKGKGTVVYAEGILKNWKEDKVVDLDGVKKADEKHEEEEKASREKKASKTTKTYNQFNDFPQRKYTKEQEDELERQLLNKNHTQEELDSVEERLAKYKRGQ